MEKLVLPTKEYKISIWLNQLSNEINKQCSENEKGIMEMWNWKWKPIDPKNPTNVESDLGIPITNDEMVAFIMAKRYMRADSDTEDGYIKYISNGTITDNVEYYNRASSARNALKKGRDVIMDFCPEQLLVNFMKGRIDSWENFKTQINNFAEVEEKKKEPTMGELRKILKNIINNEAISMKDKQSHFRDELESFLIQNEEKGFEYGNFEGDDLFYRGCESFSPILSSISLLLSTLTMSNKQFNELDKLAKENSAGVSSSKSWNLNKSVIFDRAESIRGRLFF